jgi:hypothetical protein
VQLERDDRPHAGAPDRVPNLTQFGQVQARGLFQQQVLAGPGRRHCLTRVQVVRRGDGDDVDVLRAQQVGELRCEPGIPEFEARVGQAFPRPPLVPAAQRDDAGTRVLAKGPQVLDRDPADTGQPDAER